MAFDKIKNAPVVKKLNALNQVIEYVGAKIDQKALERICDILVYDGTEITDLNLLNLCHLAKTEDTVFDYHRTVFIERGHYGFEIKTQGDKYGIVDAEDHISRMNECLIILKSIQAIGDFVKK